MGHGPNWYTPPGAEPKMDPLADATDETSVEYASFQIRVAARVVDAVAIFFCGVAGTLLAVFFLALSRRHPVTHDDHDRVRLTVAIGWVLMWLTYHAISEAVGGATIGKWICDLRVVGERLERCTPLAAVIRNVAFLIDAMFFGLVARLSMKSVPRRQRFGDRWAGTAVVVARTLRAPSAPGFGCLMGSLSAAALYTVTNLIAFR
jgi:uncharacterized RDD family membrane protein YckC